jgi:hypothetical protein
MGKGNPGYLRIRYGRLLLAGGWIVVEKRLEITLSNAWPKIGMPNP